MILVDESRIEEVEVSIAKFLADVASGHFGHEYGRMWDDFDHISLPKLFEMGGYRCQELLVSFKWVKLHGNCDVRKNQPVFNGEKPLVDGLLISLLVINLTFHTLYYLLY